LGKMRKSQRSKDAGTEPAGVVVVCLGRYARTYLLLGKNEGSPARAQMPVDGELGVRQCSGEGDGGWGEPQRGVANPVCVAGRTQQESLCVVHRCAAGAVTQAAGNANVMERACRCAVRPAVCESSRDVRVACSHATVQALQPNSNRASAVRYLVGSLYQRTSINHRHTLVECTNATGVAYQWERLAKTQA